MIKSLKMVFVMILLAGSCFSQNKLVTSFTDKESISVSSEENVNVPAIAKENNSSMTPSIVKASHYIGEEFGGGVIFLIFQDRQGVDHGLIVSKKDIGYSYIHEQLYNEMGPAIKGRLIDSSKVYNWCPVINDYVKLVKASNLRDGLKNSNLISQNTESSAAAICLNLNENGFDDWYLPAIEELTFLYRSKTAVFPTTEPKADQMEGQYWSSTEINDRNAWTMSFSSGTKIETKKQEKRNIRPIRAF